MEIAFLFHVLCCGNCVCVLFLSATVIFPLKKLFLTALHDFKVVSPALEVFVL